MYQLLPGVFQKRNGRRLLADVTKSVLQPLLKASDAVKDAWRMSDELLLKHQVYRTLWEVLQEVLCG